MIKSGRFMNRPYNTVPYCAQNIFAADEKSRKIAAAQDAAE